MFTYMRSKVRIDDEEVDVRIAIRKKVATNWFWIHHIDENKKRQSYPADYPQGGE